MATAKAPSNPVCVLVLCICVCWFTYDEIEFLFLYNIRKFVDTFINFPKPLVAALNGPAVGISVTILALYDFVYARESVRMYT